MTGVAVVHGSAEGLERMVGPIADGAKIWRKPSGDMRGHAKDIKMLFKKVRSGLPLVTFEYEPYQQQTLAVRHPALVIAQIGVAQAVLPPQTDPLEAVAQITGVSPEDIIGRARKRHITRARHMAFCLIRETTDLSYPAIGRAYDRDHSTIMHAVETARSLQKEDKLFAQQLEAARQSIMAAQLDEEPAVHQVITVSDYGLGASEFRTARSGEYKAMGVTPGELIVTAPTNMTDTTLQAVWTSFHGVARDALSAHLPSN